MTDTPQSPAPAQAGDAERDDLRLARIRSIRDHVGEPANFLLRLLDARDARIADQLRQLDSWAKRLGEVRGELAEVEEERDCLTAALADQRAIAAEAQRGNAATIGKLREALEPFAELADSLEATRPDKYDPPSMLKRWTEEIKPHCDFARAVLRRAAAAEREPGR